MAQAPSLFKKLLLGTTIVGTVVSMGFFVKLAIQSWNSESARQSAIMHEVVDGDTIVVKINNRKQTVRLLLVDTPNDKKEKFPQKFGAEATAYLNTLIKKNDVLTLEFETMHRDNASNLLAYVFDSNNTFINEKMLTKGFGRLAYIYEPASHEKRTYIHKLEAAEAFAKQDKLNIWSVPNFVQLEGFSNIK